MVREEAAELSGEEKQAPGRWGITKRGDRAHFFVKRADNGKCESLCGRMKCYDEAVNARLGMDQWDPDDPRTCKTCLSLRRWFRVGTEAEKINP